MKSRQFLLCLILLLGINYVQAQTLKLAGFGTSSIFTIDENGTNLNLWGDFQPIRGSESSCTLIREDGKYWGVTKSGGSNGEGVIFNINTDGSNYQVVHNFNETTGSTPHGSLIMSGGKFWGMTRTGGGTGGVGVIFSLEADGTGYTVVHTFIYEDGARPLGDLIESGGKFWGMTEHGGTGGAGVIFNLNLDGTGFTKAHDFSTATGHLPTASLREIENHLWGTVSAGTSSDLGAIFRIDLDGTNYTLMHEFAFNDGGHPRGNLTFSNGKVWGAASDGGGNGYGVIFHIDTDGANYTVAHSFRQTDGEEPWSDLVEVNSELWGTTLNGGANNGGVIYSIKNDGAEFKEVRKLAQFEGVSPQGSFLYDGTKLLSVTTAGGKTNHGTIFSIRPDETDFKKEFDFGANVFGGLLYGGLVPSNTKLWGMTTYGGDVGQGVIFTINIDGSELTEVHSFDGENGGIVLGNTLTPVDKKIWGMTANGGISDMGTIFHINDDGNGFTKVHDFDGTNGDTPYGQLLEFDGKCWGMTVDGGVNNTGVIFNINLDGTGFSKILDFTNDTGHTPFGNSLSYHGGKIWGTTQRGGIHNRGVLFQMNSDGTGYTKIRDFQSATGSSVRGKLVEENGKLWGMSAAGGAHSNGVIYSIDLTGSNYVVVHEFEQGDLDNGSTPLGGLVAHKKQLWGYTLFGGSDDLGVVFRIDNDGSNYEKVSDLTYALGQRPTYGSLLVVKNFQSVTFEPIPDDLAEDSGDFNLIASSNFNLPFSFSSSNSEVASITGSTVSINNSGEVTITALQVGNDTFFAAQARQILTISSILGLLEKENSIVYPNPTRDYFRVNFKGSSKAISLVNLDGKTIKSYSKQISKSYSLKDVSLGVYLILTDKNSLLGKLIVE